MPMAAVPTAVCVPFVSIVGEFTVVHTLIPSLHGLQRWKMSESTGMGRQGFNARVSPVFVVSSIDRPVSAKTNGAH